VRATATVKPAADSSFGMAIADRTDPVRAWLTAAAVGLVALGGGALAFPGWVYDRFVWQYFWGPVYADANGARCAVMDGGTAELLFESTACEAALARGAIYAEPGYTFVSEAGYAVVLLFMLVGVYLLLDRLGLGERRGFFFALLPFMFFGGALRVVEDANDAATAAGVEPLLAYPANVLVISPVIYFSMFVLSLAALLGSVALSRRGTIERYEPTLAAVGTVILVLTVAYLGYLAAATEYVGFFPQMPVLTLGLASLLAGGIYLAIERSRPGLNAGTRYIGLVVLWSQAIDGVANVLAADWATAIGLPFAYSAKHPVNQIIVGATETVFPPSVIEAIGDSWPFPLVKLALAVGVLWLFDESIFAESRRYALLLLVAIVAVGLGPGTRDMLRATFGI
jgi:uncharacterized membrane protein